MHKNIDYINKQIHIQGLVQGVGFRPYIYRLAGRYELFGWVENRNDGVFIKVEGTPVVINNFINSISKEAPLASNIISIESKNIALEYFTDFTIIKSENKSDEITEVSPDIAVCSECIEDLKTQKHRIEYPFINCTNCGPRFTIIKDLPYDRKLTSMALFKMCSKCNAEYTEILNRRFHAQPIACSHCGPTYELHYNDKIFTDFEDILTISSQLLDDGKLLAMKGLGGYHLACDAKKQEVVVRLREAKIRDGKPFALMCRDTDAVRSIANLTIEEEKLLTSWRKPIVLLKNRKKLAKGICIGFNSVGVMLPYMPFHYQLFEKLKTSVIVLTSGNISDEPIIIDNDLAIHQLGTITDAILTYNRDIYNRTDDSVAFVTNNKTRLIRRSRGFVPNPIRLNLNTEGIFAAGAELVNCFALGRGEQVILSQHIGDLKNLETLEFYTESIDRFKKLFRFKPTLIAHDLHPDYLSTKYAMDQNIPKVGIQHHHAHIASCMAEHQLDEKVIGIVFDGVGLGDDGKIWGGEFLVCDLVNYERISYFDYVKMPGGDKATKNPWRMAVSYLHKYIGGNFEKNNFEFLKQIPKKDLGFILEMLNKNINCPETSSCGRLFDAVSALINLCTVASFHAEAPMRLEAAIEQNIKESYGFDYNKTIILKSTFEEIISDLNKGINQGIITAKFHNTIINIIFAVAKQLKLERGLNKVVLSGGSFQNQYILSRIENVLTNNNFEVYSHLATPCNDGGLALGQIAISAKRRELGLL
jgi:hydrogenase maturation protein HypF